MSVNKVIKNLTAVSILCLSGVTTAFADGNEKTVMAFELGQVKFNEATARQEGIKNSATFIRLAAEKQSGIWLFGGGFAGFFYSDNESFKQNVVDQFGNRTTAKSTSNSTNLFAEAGLTYAISNKLSSDILLGYELMMSSSRSIDKCSNCTTDKIKVKAGSYISPRLAYEWDNVFKLSLVYRSFLSGDVKSALGLNAAFYF